MINLKIDPEFQSQIPPLTDDEFKQLEENILKEGKLLSPLIVWNNTLVDGHNRYAILQKHPEIYFSTMPLRFENREEAIAWICRNQLGRRNLSPEQKRYLLGKQYEAEKKAAKIFRGNQYTLAKKSGGDHGDNPPLWKENPVTGSQRKTVSAVPPFSAPATIHEASTSQIISLPGIKQKVFSGEVKFTNEEMSSLCRQVSSIVQMSLLKSCIQRHWKCWNLPAQNLNLKKRNSFPCPHHKQKNFGAIMYRTSL